MGERSHVHILEKKHDTVTNLPCVAADKLFIPERQLEEHGKSPKRVKADRHHISA
jgi:hypothetical protein